MFELDATLLSDVQNVDFSKHEGGLPFAVRHFYAVNGDVRMINANNPALYFGGFATEKAEWDAFVTQNNLPPMPGLVPGFTGQGSAPVEVVATRALYIVPVAIRRRWLVQDGKVGQPEYTPGARQHVQALVCLGIKETMGQPIHFYAPAILTAKGYQATNLTNAIAAWPRHTAQLRNELAPNIPAWMFWMMVGTFGERHSEMVGKGTKSSITPIGPYLPEMTEAILKATYGGDEIARKVLEYRKQAVDWLAAWDKPASTAPAGPALVNGSAPLPAEYATPRSFPTEPLF